MINPFYNKLIKPIRDSNINNLLDRINTNKIFPADVKFTFNERLDTITDLTNNFTQWIEPFFTGIKKFNFKYVTNGNTDALNTVLMSGNFNRVCFMEHEYSYYSYICDSLKLNKFIFNSIDQLTDNDLVLISFPSSCDGSTADRATLINALQQKGIRIFVDVAYCGLTDPFRFNFEITDNTYFAFTFSKTLSIPYNRIGLLFSNITVPGFDIMNKIGYVNLSGANTVIELMRCIPADYTYISYKDQYLDICNKLELTPTECILFAHTLDKTRVCVTQNYILQ
jgi:hypothetical protein